MDSATIAILIFAYIMFTAVGIYTFNDNLNRDVFVAIIFWPITLPILVFRYVARFIFRLPIVIYKIIIGKKL